MPLAHHFMALLVTLIWGTNFVVIEVGLGELPPFLFATLRFSLVVIPLIFFFPRPKVPWPLLLGYGFFIGFGQFGLLFWVMQQDLSPGLASLLIQIQAMITILLAYVFFKETINALQIIALGIATLGVVLVGVYSDGDATLLGLGIIMLAACSWAIGNVLVKQVSKTKDKVSIMAFIVWSSLGAVPPLLLMSLWLEGADIIVSNLQSLSAKSISVVLWQTVGNTLIGYGLWNYLLNRHAAVQVTPWALMVPVFGMWASVFWLGETMPWWKWSAAAFIILGLVLNIVGSQAPFSKRLKHSKVVDKA